MELRGVVVPDLAAQVMMSATRGEHSQRARAFGTWALVLGVAFASAAPLLFTPIPPLVDVPGHLGQYSIQLAPEGHPLRSYFAFHWRFVLNLGADFLVHLLTPLLGLVAAVRAVVTLTAMLTATAAMLLARTTSRAASAAPWALMFVWSLPFHYGFLNYTLTVALSLTGYVLWLRLEDQRALRNVLFLLLQPVLIISHAVDGAMMPLMIGSYELARLLGPMRHRAMSGRDVAGFARAVWPLTASAAVVLAWILFSDPGSGHTVWEFDRKFKAMTNTLRDQNEPFDIASAVAAYAVILFGLWKGARYRNGTAGPVIAVILLFVIAPAQLSGSFLVDMRIVPLAALLALAQLDWSAVERSTRQVVFWFGLLLLVSRLMVTTLAFIAYQADYRSELRALEHVRPGSRVLNLTGRVCDSAGWRSHRLEHISSMALVHRGAWSNSQWDIADIHAVRILYRPSPLFYHDPTHYVWPQSCISNTPRDKDPDFRRRTLAEVLPILPLDRVDYLWLINVRLPTGYRDTRLVPIWSNGRSSLFATTSPRPMAPRARP